MGKTMSGQIAATVLGCPVLALNPSQLKGGIVGETERNLANVLGALRAFGGLQLVIGTSNNLATVPEELCDRFPSGVWFFDLPTQPERYAIWRGQLARYGLAGDADVLSRIDGMTGRDVRAVCLEARRKRLDVATVAARRIPGAARMRNRIAKMRAAAQDEGYRSASTGEKYAGPIAALPEASPRKVRQAPQPAARAPEPQPAPQPPRAVRQAPQPAPADDMF